MSEGFDHSRMNFCVSQGMGEHNKDRTLKVTGGEERIFILNTYCETDIKHRMLQHTRLLQEGQNSVSNWRFVYFGGFSVHQHRTDNTAPKIHLIIYGK